MKVELSKDLVNEGRLFVVVVDAIEGAVCSIHRKCGDIQAFEIWRCDGDAGGNADTHVVELAQLLH